MKTDEIQILPCRIRGFGALEAIDIKIRPCGGAEGAKVYFSVRIKKNGRILRQRFNVEISCGQKCGQYKLLVEIPDGEFNPEYFRYSIATVECVESKKVVKEVIKPPATIAFYEPA